MNPISEPVCEQPVTNCFYYRDRQGRDTLFPRCEEHRPNPVNGGAIIVNVDSPEVIESEVIKIDVVEGAGSRFASDCVPSQGGISSRCGADPL